MGAPCKTSRQRTNPNRCRRQQSTSVSYKRTFGKVKNAIKLLAWKGGKTSTSKRCWRLKNTEKCDYPKPVYKALRDNDGNDGDDETT